MAMKKIMLALPEEMLKVLEKERKERYLETIPETVRVILSEYLRKGWLALANVKETMAVGLNQ